jgi:hypothetical protein
MQLRTAAGGGAPGTAARWAAALGGDRRQSPHGRQDLVRVAVELHRIPDAGDAAGGIDEEARAARRAPLGEDAERPAGLALRVGKQREAQILVLGERDLGLSVVGADAE